MILFLVLIICNNQFKEKSVVRVLTPSDNAIYSSVQVLQHANHDRSWNIRGYFGAELDMFAIVIKGLVIWRNMQ